MTVIDIGASYGLFSNYIANLSIQNNDSAKSIEVFAVEPIPKVASQIGKRKNLVVINKAVVDRARIPESGFLKLKVMKNSELSTFLEINPEIDSDLWYSHMQSLIVESEISVPCLTLETLINENSIESVDFLKIDTQGTDLEVLLSAGNEIHKIKSCVLEFPYTKESAIYSNEKEITEGIQILRKLDFIPVRIVPNGSGECNAFFRSSKFSIEEYFEMEGLLGFERAPTLKIGKHNSKINMTFIQRIFSTFKELILRFKLNKYLKNS
jgi:FkbM family methyltransferase